MLLGPLQSTAPLYRRSPFQVAILLFFTFGVYTFFWAYHVRRWCEVTMERPNASLWKSIALIVPLFNLFLLYDLGGMIKGVAFRAGTPVNNSLPMLGVVAFGLRVLYRLPGAWALISAFYFVPIVLMHVPFEQAQLAVHGPAAAPTRFHWIEWIAIAIGALLWIDLLTVYPIATAIEGVVAAVIVFGFVKWQSDTILKASLQA